TTSVLTVLSTTQVLTFTIFVTFYIPCVATMAVLSRELDKKWMLLISGITLGIATSLALLARLFGIGFLGS
ncbi:MAG: hypothetical protein WAN36_04780, partial [Calditrichia bacterium]